MATNQYEEDDFDDLDAQDAGQPQTNDRLVRDLRKQIKERDRQLKDINDKFESLSKIEKERVVKSVLDAKGVNQKAARLIMKDLDDVNDESVNRWLDDNGDLFGLVKEQVQDPQQQLDRAALRQQDIVTQNAMTPTPDTDVLERLNNATSAEEIIKMINSGRF